MRDRAAFYRQWRRQLNAGMPQPAAQLRGAMHFEPFERALLAMAEESGKLDDVLEHLADFHTRQHRLVLKMKQWLAYPMFVSLVAVLLLPLPLVFQGRVGAYWAATGVCPRAIRAHAGAVHWRRVAAREGGPARGRCLGPRRPRGARAQRG